MSKFFKFLFSDSDEDLDMTPPVVKPPVIQKGSTPSANPETSKDSTFLTHSETKEDAKSANVNTPKSKRGPSSKYKQSLEPILSVEELKQELKQENNDSNPQPVVIPVVTVISPKPSKKPSKKTSLLESIKESTKHDEYSDKETVNSNSLDQSVQSDNLKQLPIKSAKKSIQFVKSFSASEPSRKDKNDKKDQLKQGSTSFHINEPVSSLNDTPNHQIKSKKEEEKVKIIKKQLKSPSSELANSKLVSIDPPPLKLVNPIHDKSKQAPTKNEPLHKESNIKHHDNVTPKPNAAIRSRTSSQSKPQNHSDNSKNTHHESKIHSRSSFTKPNTNHTLDKEPRQVVKNEAADTTKFVDTNIKSLETATSLPKQGPLISKTSVNTIEEVNTHTVPEPTIPFSVFGQDKVISRQSSEYSNYIGLEEYAQAADTLTNDSGPTPFLKTKRN